MLRACVILKVRLMLRDRLEDERHERRTVLVPHHRDEGQNSLLALLRRTSATY